MNRFGLNRSTLNGVVSALVLATASISCSAGVNAIAIRQADALSPASNTGSFTAQPTVTQHLASNFSGAGELYPQVTHTRVSHAQLDGGAEVLAYVLRHVSTQAACICGANVIAVVASTMATADVDSDVLVLADATRVQAARSSAASVSGVEISIDPTVWRMASAIATLGVASVRAETAIKLNGESFFTDACYASVSAGAEILTAELLVRKPIVVLSGGASNSGIGTIRQAGRASAQGSAAIVSADPFVTAVPFARSACSSAINAIAVRKLVPVQIQVSGTGTFSGSALQKHVARATTLCGASFLATGMVTRYVGSTLISNAGATATATRGLKPVAMAIGEAGLVVAALRTAQASSTPEGTADVAVAAVRRVIPDSIALDATALIATSAEKLFYPQVGIACVVTVTPIAVRVCIATGLVSCTANLSGQATIIKIGVATCAASTTCIATAVRYVKPSVAIETSSAVTANAVRGLKPISTIVSTTSMVVSSNVIKIPVSNVYCGATIEASMLLTRIAAASISCTAAIYVDTVTNPASYDPSDRTFYSPERTTNFMRPFIETEFKRAA